MYCISYCSTLGKYWIGYVCFIRKLKQFANRVRCSSSEGARAYSYNPLLSWLSPSKHLPGKPWPIVGQHFEVQTEEELLNAECSVEKHHAGRCDPHWVSIYTSIKNRKKEEKLHRLMSGSLKRYTQWPWKITQCYVKILKDSYKCIWFQATLATTTLVLGDGRRKCYVKQNELLQKTRMLTSWNKTSQNITLGRDWARHTFFGLCDVHEKRDVIYNEKMNHLRHLYHRHAVKLDYYFLLGTSSPH